MEWRIGVWPNQIQLGVWGVLLAPQRGPGRSPGCKRILATIYWKLAKNQVSGSPSTPQLLKFPWKYYFIIYVWYNLFWSNDLSIVEYWFHLLISFVGGDDCTGHPPTSIVGGMHPHHPPMIYARGGSIQWLTRSQCDIWHFMFFTRWSTEGTLDFFSEQTKHTGFPFCAMKKYWSVHVSCNTRRSPSIFLCFNTAISNSTRSTEKNRFYGRKTDSSKSARSRHYYLAKSARSRHSMGGPPIPYRVWSLEWTIARYVLLISIPKQSCVQESVVGKNERCLWRSSLGDEVVNNLGLIYRPSLSLWCSEGVVDGMPRAVSHYNLGTSHGLDKIGSRARGPCLARGWPRTMKTNFIDKTIKSTIVLSCA